MGVFTWRHCSEGERGSFRASERQSLEVIGCYFYYTLLVKASFNVSQDLRQWGNRFPLWTGVVKKLWPYWTHGRVFQMGRTPSVTEEKREHVKSVVGILRGAAWLKQRKTIGQLFTMTPGRQPEKPTGYKLRNRTSMRGCQTSVRVPCPLPQRIPSNSPSLLFSLFNDFLLWDLRSPWVMKVPCPGMDLTKAFTDFEKMGEQDDKGQWQSTWALEPDRPRFKPCLHHVKAIWHLVSHVTILNLQHHMALK